MPTHSLPEGHMFCANCGTEAVVGARYCTKCGRQLPEDASGGPVGSSGGTAPLSAPPIKVPWFEGKRNLIGISVLSAFLYLYVVMTTLAGAALRGNEALYIAAWTGVVFYVLWKRRNWKGWQGAFLGFFAGIAFVFVASAMSGLFR